jgi:hypothetical protein
MTRRSKFHLFVFLYSALCFAQVGMMDPLGRSLRDRLAKIATVMIDDDVGESSHATNKPDLTVIFLMTTAGMVLWILTVNPGWGVLALCYLVGAGCVVLVRTLHSRARKSGTADSKRPYAP